MASRSTKRSYLFVIWRQRPIHTSGRNPAPRKCLRSFDMQRLSRRGEKTPFWRTPILILYSFDEPFLNPTNVLMPWMHLQNRIIGIFWWKLEERPYKKSDKKPWQRPWSDLVLQLFTARFSLITASEKWVIYLVEAVLGLRSFLN